MAVIVDSRDRRDGSGLCFEDLYILDGNLRVDAVVHHCISIWVLITHFVHFWLEALNFL